MKPPRVLVLATLALASSPPAHAHPELLASDGQNLLSIDECTFAVQPIGPMQFVEPSELLHGGLALDSGGKLWSMTSARVYTVDPASGQTSSVGSFGSGIYVAEGGLAFHPTTGEAFGATAGSSADAHLVKIDPGTGAATIVGDLPAASHDFNGLAFDANGQLYGIDRPSNALWRIDHLNPDGPGTVMVGTGLGANIDLGAAGGLTYDADSNTLWGYAWDSHALITVDPSTGVGQIVVSFDGSVPHLLSLAEFEGPSSFAYGAGCPGSGLIVPKLTLDACPLATGQPITIGIENALGGAQAFLVFGSNQGHVPMEPGCALLVQPLLPPIVPIPLGGAGAGNGQAILATTLPAGLPTPFSFTMQLFVADSGGFTSFSNSHGLDVFVEN